LKGRGAAESKGAQEATDEVVDRFHQLYYDNRRQTWNNTRWLGIPLWKCPLDLWVYQEILFARRPGLIIETGTHRGGSALFLASMLDLIDSGRVITIDVTPRDDRPAHPRIEYRTGSSVAPEIVAGVRESIRPGESVMAIFDSDHARDHVLAELRAFAPLVTPGDYLIVEDTNINGHPVWPEFGPGPMEAVEEFLVESDAFEADRSREKYFLTQNPRGYLRRVK
jgi:cephalosporin hydroxylase